MSDPKTMQHQYDKWKLSIPFLYDWFANHDLVWPSICCRWGPPISETTYKRKQYLYMSERTDGSDPNKLMLIPLEICKPRVASVETIAGFRDEGKSPFVRPAQKTILHKGEVNKMRELPENPSIVATHSDAKEVYIWHFDRQPNRAADKKDWKRLSVPDLTLTGHTENAEFALSTSSAAPYVASGGQDTNVLLWNLADYDNGSLMNPQGTSSEGAQLAANTTLQGHEQVVGDLVFRPATCHELASVGDDSALLFWDTRAGTSPSLKVAQAHGDQGIQCVDWSLQDPNFVATGAADGGLKVWDKRNTGQAAFSFDTHTSPLLRVEWANYPKNPGVLASGGEDGIICVWDLKSAQPAAGTTKHPPQLLFQHAGHRSPVADFQWHPTDPFTMVSVTDDNAGGTMHMWRINDLIYRPEQEVIKELEQYKEDILPAGDRRKEGAAKPRPEPRAESKAESKAEPMDIDSEAPQGKGATVSALTPAKVLEEAREEINAAVSQQQA